VLAKKEGVNNLSEINLSGNKMGSKAGVFIGDPLLNNPDYRIFRIIFENISLGIEGLQRMMDAANENKNIKHLHLGIITDEGLLLLASMIA
jgi:hypothetical protein